MKTLATGSSRVSPVRLPSLDPPDLHKQWSKTTGDMVHCRGLRRSCIRNAVSSMWFFELLFCTLPFDILWPNAAARWQPKPEHVGTMPTGVKTGLNWNSLYNLLLHAATSSVDLHVASSDPWEERKTEHGMVNERAIRNTWLKHRKHTKLGTLWYSIFLTGIQFPVRQAEKMTATKTNKNQHNDNKVDGKSDNIKPK